MKNSGPLSGLKVLEVAQYAAGPFAGLLLADLGADVVKIERPEGGDLLRSWPPHLVNDQGDAFSASFSALNRGKRSLSLDLGGPNDRATMIRLVEAADVLLENFRPGVLAKLGLSYDALNAVNPRLVYCSVTGFGQTGPSAKRGAFDVTVQAESGLMSVTGDDPGEPVKCGVPVADLATALYAGLTILATVNQARETGLGAHVDCSMFGCMLGISALQTSEYFATGEAPKRLGSRHPKNAPTKGFRAATKASSSQPATTNCGTPFVTSLSATISRMTRAFRPSICGPATKPNSPIFCSRFSRPDRRTTGSTPSMHEAFPARRSIPSRKVSTIRRHST